MAYLGNLDDLIRHAQDVIFETYGDTVSVSEKKKDLIKFGTNPNVGTTRSTIWYTGQDNNNEIYIADNVNSIDSISSSYNPDSEVVKIEGHTMTGGNRTFVSQTATLNGRNRVALTTALNRVTRVAHNDDSSTDLVGEIYVYEDTALTSGKPINTKKIHLTIPSGSNQSKKSSTSLSSTDYWIVTGFSGGSLEKTGTNTTEIELQVRVVGGVFKPVSKPIVVNTGTDTFREFTPYVIIPKNADVRLTALSSSGGQEITGDIQGFLAEIV